jgi:hypothetical protein
MSDSATTDRKSREAKARQDVVRNAPTTPGKQLNNGATIIANRFLKELDEHRELHIVLAISGGFQPYVVWERVLGVSEGVQDDKGGRLFKPLDFCIQGNYHRSLDEAVEAYNSRS